MDRTKVVRSCLGAVGIPLICSSMCVVAFAAGGEWVKTKVTFSSKTYDFAQAQTPLLDAFVKAAQAEPQKKIVIQDYSSGFKKGSLQFIQMRNRTLRIFQVFARAGIDPARIQFEPAALPKSPQGAQDSVAIELRNSESVLTTKRLTPQGTQQPVRQNASDFTILFPSASAEPTQLDANKFQTFLATVGAPGRDALVIEGHTDKVGNVAYNQALGELRALSVYERLLRAGIPPYRIDTRSYGKSGSSEGPGDAGDASGGRLADRRVVVKWTKNEVIAQAAAKADIAAIAPVPVPTPTVQITPAAAPVAAPSPTPTAQPTPREAAQPSPTPSPVPSALPEDNSSSLFDIVPFAGVLTPMGELYKNAKSGPHFGLGIGKAFIISPDAEVRATLFATLNSKLPAKQKDRSGDLKVRSIFVRADYALSSAFDSQYVRPFVGLGLGIYTWKGGISQPSTARQNNGSKNDLGAQFTLGLDFILMPSLFLAPEFTAHAVFGQFSSALFSSSLSLRWRL